MAVKVFKAIWFLSVLSIMTALLYHYAGLPENVVIGQEEINFITLPRDTFFYLAIILVALINVSVYIVRKQAAAFLSLQAWFYGFIGVINFFLIIGLSFIALFNSNEVYRYGEIGFIIYGSIFLVGLWILGGVVYWLISRIKPKNVQA